MKTVFNFNLLSPIAITAVCLSACVQNSGPNIEFDRKALLTNVGDNIVRPSLVLAHDSSTSLQSFIDTWCAALANGPAPSERQVAQASWRSTMTAWQYVELMQIGPLADNGNALRDNIYSWPLVDRCNVDLETNEARLQGNAYSLAGKLVDRKGLDALEYLLFAPTTDHNCDVAPTGWDSLTEQEINQARCSFASLAAAELASNTRVVVETWGTLSDGYLADLSSAGESTSTIGSAQGAMNLVSDAMFYIDTEVKDMKLGKPAGIQPNSCGMGVICPDDLESNVASHSSANIVANLKATRQVFLGSPDVQTAGVGFDDLLIAAGAPDVAQSMAAALDNAIAEAEKLSDDMQSDLTGGQAEVTYNAIREFTTTLKSQFFTITGLELPEMGAGDND